MGSPLSPGWRWSDVEEHIGQGRSVGPEFSLFFFYLRFSHIASETSASALDGLSINMLLLFCFWVVVPAVEGGAAT